MNFLLSLWSISEYRYDIAAVEQHSDFKYANNVDGLAQTVLNPQSTNPRMLRLLFCECFGNSYLGLQLSSFYKVSLQANTVLMLIHMKILQTITFF